MDPSFVKLFWSVLHYYHLLLHRASDVWRAVEKKRKTKLWRTWKGKYFSSNWVLEWFFYFFFEKTSIYFLCGLLLIMLLVPVGKLSNSRFQMFYKIDALKNLAILTGKHLCWSFFSINFIRKILQHGCFYVNIAKCLSTAFL